VYSRNGARVAVDTFGGAIFLVERGGTGVSTHVLRGHTGIASSVAFVGETLLSGALDGHVRIWNLSDGTSRSVLDGSSGIIASVAAPPDTLYSLDSMGRVSAVGVDGRTRLVATIPGRVQGLAIAAGGKTLLVHEERAIHAVDTDTGSTRAIAGHPAPGYGFAMAADGTWFVRGTIDGRIEVRTLDGVILHAGHYGGRCSRAAVSATGEIAVACGTVVVTLQRHPEWAADARALEIAGTSVAYSPDGRYLALGNQGGLVYVLDRSTSSLAVRRAVTGGITSLTFAPDRSELTITTSSPEVHTLQPADLEFVPSTTIPAWIAARGDTTVSSVDEP
jgi:WD40 repeat protein